MDFNTFVNGLSWKKIIVIALGVIVSIWVLREIIFWSFFHEAERVFSKLNTQISEQQKDIQKKIADSDQEFNERSKKMDEQSDEFQRFVDQRLKEGAEYFDKVDKEREARDAAFDKAFKEAPAKMWAEHERIGKEMRDDFFRKSRDMDQAFKKNVMNVDKTLESTRCHLALSKDFEGISSSNLTPEQLQEQKATIKRIQKEIAKREHCEAYL